MRCQRQWQYHANTDENNADVDDDGDGDDDDNDDNDDNDENDENDDAVDDDDGAENSKLKSKKKTLVHMYLKKPIMRDTITCILLKEYKLGLIHDANYIKKGNENGIFFVWLDEHIDWRYRFRCNMTMTMMNDDNDDDNDDDDDDEVEDDDSK